MYLCRVTASCPAPLLVEPSAVEFGDLAAGDDSPVALKVRRRDGEPLKIGELNVSFSPNEIQVRKAQIRDGSVVLWIHLAKSAPDVLYGSVKLRLDGTEDELPIPVHARRVNPISIAPSTVLVRRSAEGHWRPVNLMVCIRGHGTRFGAMTVSRLAPGLRVEDEGTVAGGRIRLLRLSVWDPSQWEAQAEESKLSVSFKGIPETVTATVVKRDP